MLRLLFRRNRTTDLARLLLALDTIAGADRAPTRRSAIGVSFGRS